LQQAEAWREVPGKLGLVLGKVQVPERKTETGSVREQVKA
jgi:hypothetical protein